MRISVSRFASPPVVEREKIHVVYKACFCRLSPCYFYSSVLAFVIGQIIAYIILLGRKKLTIKYLVVYLIKFSDYWIVEKIKLDFSDSSLFYLFININLIIN